MEAAFAVNWEYATSTYTDSSSPVERAFHPTWKEEPIADPLSVAIEAAGEEGALITEGTKKAAVTLLALLSDHPAPEITVDSSEIAFEWYKDRHHVAVLSVDGSNIRWAAMVGADNPISGIQLFTGEVPQAALHAIEAAT